MWASSLSARAKRDLAKAQKSQRNEATSIMSNPYSIEACMDMLEAMKGSMEQNLDYNQVIIYSTSSDSFSNDEDDDILDLFVVRYLMNHEKRNASVEEGVAMGLAILCHGIHQRIVAKRFQHSLGTVHKWCKMVIRALAATLGAIDGTHVATWSPTSKQKMFCGRKAPLVAQNIMAACSHNMIFTFVYSGWEGIANDS
ncbi:hypothetical protein GH714_032076 [Hevea brasiliensis]|uniref:DUF8040 domain-containing protein n=1 Tax=Hevea brasiliensis TaxID=3981 RepID=A0A6A6M7C5_HEVBR|nr:hypothetical protein GH714_032076 [Hevea brasiliensis]